MKPITIALVTAGLLCAIACIQAYPQQTHFQRQPYRPPPTRPPRPLRLRRQAVGGKLASNPSGGADATLSVSQGIGNPDHNAIATAFPSGNTDHGPVTTGGRVAYNNNGLGAAITKEHLPGIRDTLTTSASANLFKDNVQSIDANVYKSKNDLANGFQFERNGASVDWSHINGHSASFGQSSIPDFGKQLSLSGTANLWSSLDKNTRLDLTGQGSKWVSGPFNGRTDYGANLGLTHMFG